MADAKQIAGDRDPTVPTVESTKFSNQNNYLSTSV